MINSDVYRHFEDYKIGPKATLVYLAILSDYTGRDTTISIPYEVLCKRTRLSIDEVQSKIEKLRKVRLLAEDYNTRCLHPCFRLLVYPAIWEALDA